MNTALSSVRFHSVASPVREVLFVGASASQSHVNRYFDQWMKICAPDVHLRTHDLAIGASEESYEAFIGSLTENSNLIGCVVTNHKVKLYNEFQSRFTRLAPTCHSLGVVSVMRRTADGLEGDAEEVRAIVRAVDRICSFRRKRHFPSILVLGAGGAGRALTLALLQRQGIYGFADLIVTDTDLRRVQELSMLSKRWPSRELLSVVHASGPRNDHLVGSAPAGSLVVNATGLGKDCPGSPLSNSTKFPRRAAVWDLNYRGSLEFLFQARAQAHSRDITVHEGTPFFVSGWFEALTYILALDSTHRMYRHFNRVVGLPFG